MLEKLKETETKIQILYLVTFLIFALELLYLSSPNPEIIDIVFVVNLGILIFGREKAGAKGHEEAIEVLGAMMLITALIRLLKGP
ncbi:hypothetical protein [Methanobacterium alcaliphilum]|uniref:hypothetical protein n=1 Tax=Methanobacterium alcaliphilum TaxID=392018 RepID=UPI00200A04BE|nr:hypothetical protein [Methanobacterium alcaliphilum]MCK9151835.1 hypothetical protein [Methanobacterium alcaliphilum]